MKIIEIASTPISETPHKVDVRKIYDQDTAQVMHITLKSGESLKPHITPVDVFFYILAGKVDVRVGDETLAVEEDHLVESPKGIPHCLLNSSGQIAKILVVKAPKPETGSRLL